MKQKLISALKTKYANRGFGDKAYDGVAEFLSKTVTEEAQIEDAVTGVDGLLKAFQGEADKVRGEKAALQKELEELKAKGTGDDPKSQPKDGDDLDKKLDEKLATLLEAKVAPLQAKLDSYEAKEAASVRSNLITSKAKELGIPEWRINEGFVIPADADEAIIESTLTSIKANMTTAGLPSGNRFPLISDEKVSKEEADKIVANMKI